MGMHEMDLAVAKIVILCNGRRSIRGFNLQKDQLTEGYERDGWHALIEYGWMTPAGDIDPMLVTRLRRIYPTIT